MVKLRDADKTSSEHDEYQERQVKVEGKRYRREGRDRDHCGCAVDVREDSSIHTAHAARLARHPSQDTIERSQVHSHRDNPATGRSIRDAPADKIDRKTLTGAILPKTSRVPTAWNCQGCIA